MNVRRAYVTLVTNIVKEAVAELSTTAKSKLADFEKISGQGDLSLSE
jgi:hypothetical protein